MLIFKPVFSIMSENLITVNPEDSLVRVKEIFDAHTFHHIPVVRFREIVGMVSRSDFEHFLGGCKLNTEDKLIGELRLKRTKVEEIMTKRLGKVDPEDRINVALEVFTLNRFHALPVVKDGELVGILTPYDIMKALIEVKPEESYQAYDEKTQA